MADSTQSSFSSSSSTPTFLETPENAIIDQISGVASGLANQMYNWAQSTFAQTSAITNQAVGNFFNVSQQMLGLSNNLTGQYNNLFAPENAQLVADANSYASPSRMAVDMGQAGATQAQAGDAALQNSEEALRSYGIDPSSGRYAALDKAAAVQNAANIAGAENTQRNADIATGQRLRSEAVQVGAQLPAAIANVNNTAIQANTGASNATLANANTGANLMKLPNDYLGTAMGVKLPPTGQNSQSMGSSQGRSSSPDKGGGGGGNGGGGNGGGGNSPSGPAWGMNNPNYGGPPSLGVNGGRGPSGPTDPPPPPPGGDPMNDPFPDYGSSSGGTSDPWGAGLFGSTFGQDFGGNTYPGADPSGAFGGGGSFGGSSDQTGLGDFTYNPGANPSQGDWTQNDNPFSTGGYDPNANWGGGAGDPTSGIDTGNNPTSGSTTDTNSDFYAGDYTGTSGDDYSGAAYARGGAIPMKGSTRTAWQGPRNNFMASGGQIPSSMSPSGGQQTDDIPAQGPGGTPLHMNANEFVIPQDVALYKGQEFFQKLIEQSRKARATAPAQPTRGAPQQMR